MRNTTLLNLAALVCFPMLLTSCADLDSAPRSGVDSKQLLWLIFLDAHCEHGSASDHGNDISFVYPALILSSVPKEIKWTPDFNHDLSVGNEGDIVANATRSRSADDWIKSSGDQALINLHEKMKSLQAAILSSPEYAAVRNAHYESESAKQLYGADAATQNMATEANLRQIPAEVDAALHNQPYGPSADEVVRQRQADARNRQAMGSDSRIKKTENNLSAALVKLQKVKLKYAVPADEYYALMYKYVPSGTKAWNLSISRPNGDFVYMNINYGPWTY